MNDLVDLLRSLAGRERGDVVLLRAVVVYRGELLVFAEVSAGLSGSDPEYEASAQAYGERVYGIYGDLADHVDPRPRRATQRRIQAFGARI